MTIKQVRYYIFLKDVFILSITAFGGPQVHIALFIENLVNSLTNDSFFLNDIRTILTTPNFINLGKLHVSIVCWVVDDDGCHCFRWNSDYPIEIYLGDPMLDGFGEVLTKAIFGHEGKGFADSLSPDSDNPELMKFATLTFTTQLMSYEMIGPSPQKELGFGFAYEILYLNEDSKFVYLDNILGSSPDRVGKYHLNIPLG